MEDSDSDLSQRHAHYLRSQVPAEMQAVSRWLFAIDKVPYAPHLPEERASVTDPSTWSDFEVAVRVAEERAGQLGFVLGNGFVGVDLDHCRDRDTGELDPFAESVVQRLDSYCEISVSGTGLHILCKGTMPLGRCRTGPFEMYGDKRFFIMTGNRLSGQLTERTSELGDLHREMFPDIAPTAAVLATNTSQASDEQIREAITGSSNAKLQRLLRGDWTGYPSRSEADIALASLLSAFTRDEDQITRLMKITELQRPKWNRPGYLATTVRNASKNITPKGISPMSDTNSQNKSPRPDGTALVDLINGTGAELFCSFDSDPHISIPAGTRNITMRIDSGECRDAIMHMYFQKHHRTPSGTAVTEAISILKAMARGRERHDTFVRVARDKDSLWLDLGRADGKVIHVNTGGWSVDSNCPVKFRQPKGMQALPIPTRTSESLVVLIRRLLNIASDDDAMLVVGWLLSALRGAGPYPILCLNGEQGSAKSSATKTLRRIIDPNVVTLSSFPRSDRDLMIRAKNSHVLAFDNISHIPNWMSDALCTISTGAGLATRQLHTDDSEMLFAAARPMLMNGITDFINRDDLLSRTLVVTLNTIASEHRKTETEVDELFGELHPNILGRLLDAVALALADERKTKVPDCPRLADATVWVTASEPELDIEQGTFARCVNQNQRQSIANNLEGDIVVETIESLSLPWTGTMKELRNEIRDCEQKPGTPRALSNVLKQKQAALRQMGITYTSDRTKGKTIFTIRRVGGILMFPQKETEDLNAMPAAQGAGA